MPEKILMGCWDCTSCDRVGVRGDKYECDSCGAGRPEDVEFYLPDNPEVVTDKKGIRDAKAGSDWQCPYCDDWNPATAKECKNCAGGEIGSSKRQKTKTVVTPGTAGTKEFNKKRRLDTEQLRPHQRDIVDEVRRAYGHYKQQKQRPGPMTPEPRVRSGSPPPPPWIALALVATVGLLLALFMWTRDVHATLVHHSWTRTQDTEVFQVGLRRDGWDHPRDAYGVTSSQKIHHYDKVACGSHPEPVYSTRSYACGSTPTYSTRTVNLGNGRFSSQTYQSGSTTRYCTERYQSGTRTVTDYCDKAVYATYYHYKVDRWVPGKPRVTASKGVNPVWPDTSVDDPKKLRMAGRSGRYRLHFVADGEEKKSYHYDLEEQPWRAWRDGERAILAVGIGELVREIRRETDQ